jgi:hypothetical protein
MIQQLIMNICVYLRYQIKESMWKVIDNTDSVRGKSNDLNIAMEMAKLVDEHVTITNGVMEFVGKFGVDTIKNGLCPDGIKYDWNKASRIGATKR